LQNCRNLSERLIPIEFLIETESMSTQKLTIGLLLYCLGASAYGAVDTQPLPTWNTVEKIVEERFAKLPDFQPRDLISRSQVNGVFDELKRSGWTVRDQAAISKQVPSDDEWFVEELRTPAGRKFMRQIDHYPLAYDRIDRLSGMIMGHENVRALVRGPDGYKMLEYMTSTQYGKNLGQMLSQDPRGAGFNSSTGQLYTVADFEKRLAKSYADEVEARHQANQSR
jgi:hypothetical protein